MHLYHIPPPRSSGRGTHVAFIIVIVDYRKGFRNGSGASCRLRILLIKRFDGGCWRNAGAWCNGQQHHTHGLFNKNVAVVSLSIAVVYFFTTWLCWYRRWLALTHNSLIMNVTTKATSDSFLPFIYNHTYKSVGGYITLTRGDSKKRECDGWRSQFRERLFLYILHPTWYVTKRNHPLYTTVPAPKQYW